MTPGTADDFRTNLDYDALDRVTREEVPRDTRASTDRFLTTEYQYDRNGNLERAEDLGVNEVTEVSYTKMDMPQRVERPGMAAGETEATSYEYDGLDRLVGQVEPAGQDAGDDRETTYVLDALGRHVAEVRHGRADDPAPTANRLITAFAFDGRGNLRGVVDPSRNEGMTATEAAEWAKDHPEAWRTEYSYNDDDELITEIERPTESAGVPEVKTTYDYDDNGNRTAIHHPRDPDLVTKLTYDHRDQVVKMERPDGDPDSPSFRPTVYTRGDDGKVIAVTSPRGVADGAKESVDPRHPAAPACAEPPEGDEECVDIYTHFTTRLTYDRSGHLASRSVPFAPDQYGLPESTLEGWKVRYVRDAVGNPETVTDARGHTLTNTFFDTGDLRSTTRPSFWRLDWPGQAQHEVPDAGGRFADAGADADTQIGTGGPVLSERGPEAIGEQGGGDLPSFSHQAGNFGEVDPQGLPGILPAAGETTFAYDAAMRLKTIASVATGDQRQIDYYPGGRVEAKHWPLDRDATAADDQTVEHRFTYNRDGSLRSFADGEGFATTFTYDAYGRRRSETTPGAPSAPAVFGDIEELTRYDYDHNGNLTRRVTPRGEAYDFEFGYDSLDRLTSEVNPAGEEWIYDHDVAGNRILERSPRGSEVPGTTAFDVRHEFDAADRLVETNEPEGRTTTFEYDADGNTELIRSPGAPAGPEGATLDYETRTTYDGRGLPWQESAGTGAATRRTVREFDANGSLRRTVNGKGTGASGLPLTANDGTVSATLHATVRDYDDDNLLTHVHLSWDDADPTRYTQRIDRDAVGNVKTIVSPHTGDEQKVARTSYEYYGTGWVKSVSDEQDAPAGSTAPVKEHLVDYAYDERGLQTLWKSQHFGDDSRGRKITRQFWPNGTLKSRTAIKTLAGNDDDQSKREYRYFYNPNRSLVLMTDDQPEADGGALDRNTKFTRDAAEREIVVNEVWEQGKDTTFGYDPNGNVVKRQTDGRLDANGTYVDSASGLNDAKTTTFAYDAMDREIRMRVTQGDDATRLITRGYHPSGQLERKTVCRSAASPECDSTNDVIEDHYFGPLGEPTRLRRKRRGAADWRKDTVYEHDANGNRTKDERGEHKFNARDQLVEWTRGDKYDEKADGVVTYRLDGTGAIQQKTDQQDPDDSLDNTVTTYTYDGSKLTKSREVMAGVPQQETTFTYDDFGSVVKSRTDPLVGNGVLPPLNDLPELSAVCGEMDTHRDTTQYCYDEFERLVATRGPMSATEAAKASVYVYDGLDRRTKRTVKTATGEADGDLAYVGASRMLTREKDAATGRHKYYDYDSRGERQGISKSAAGSVDPTEHHDYGLDANGSVEELAEGDGERVDGSEYLYDPYGQSENGEAGDSALGDDADQNPFRFEGFYYDSGVKTYDMHARQYRPDVGRFLSQDRFESGAADLELQADPLTQNRYAFAGGNPVNRVEFDGHIVGNEGGAQRAMKETSKTPRGQRRVRSQEIYHPGRTDSTGSPPVSIYPSQRPAQAPAGVVNPAATLITKPPGRSYNTCLATLPGFGCAGWRDGPPTGRDGGVDQKLFELYVAAECGALANLPNFCDEATDSTLGEVGSTATGLIGPGGKLKSLAGGLKSLVVARDRDRLLRAAQDPRLRDTINQLYRRDAKIGNGSAMDALRFEKRTGQLLSPKGHGLKLVERRTHLQRIFRGLEGKDRQIARDLMANIQDALGGP